MDVDHPSPYFAHHMKTITKATNKQILKDPIAAFHKHFPYGDAKQVTLLEAQWAEYCAQKKQLKVIHEQTGQTSRKIGEAKRQGDPVVALLTHMRELSSQAKEISQTVHETGERIVTFFHTEGQNKTKQPTKEKESTHQQGSVNKWEGRTYSGIPDIGSDATKEVKSDETISIAPLSTEHEPSWNQYVMKNPAASLYHRVEWRRLIQETFGHESVYLLARDSSNHVKGVLPLIRLKSRLFGDFLVSMPYFNYGGAIADTPAIEQKLMDSANEKASSLGVSHCEYRDDIPRETLPAQTDKVNMILSLPDTADALWEGFSPKLRAQIKRPQRENPQILCGREELLDDFYRVFSRNMRDLGTPVYGKAFFRNILKIFPDQSHIMVIRLGNRPVAAGFLLGHGDTLEIPWASTIRDVNHLSVNMLLYWEVLRFAMVYQYRYFDFGRSSKDSGTLKFKQQWGAQAKQLHWHYWLANDTEMPSLNPNNPKYALMISIWKRLPIPVTKWLGPMIVKNLP